jgi:hypothetical protein
MNTETTTPELEMTTDLPLKVKNAQNYEVITEKIRTLLEETTNNEWEIGDLIGAVTKDVPKKQVREVLVSIAKDTGLEYSTVTQREWISSRFPKEKRNIAPNLSYTHYRVAAGLENPVEALEKASDEGMTVAQFKSYITAEKDAEKIKDEGLPCARPGCLCALSLDSKDRVTIYLYNKKFICCSMACAGNIVINNLLQLKQKIMGNSVPADSNTTPLVQHPDAAVTMKDESWAVARKVLEQEFLADKYLSR